MIFTEPTVPPPEYLPERAPRKPYEPSRKIELGPDLADALYADFARRWSTHDVWALRHWRTPHNCHVEHWHGMSQPGRCK